VGVIEWDVYVDEIFLGTVFAPSEQSARLAALAKFEPPVDACISVKRR